ncbi:MAG: caspase family protein, partial [Acidobacteria bacterium]|nr:caspase family protein [Acidobacteriota bacterium]
SVMVITGAQTSTPKNRGVGTRADLTKLPAASKRWALLVGVDEYESGRISPLMGASNDAEKLAEALVKYAGFPKDQVIVLSSKQPEGRRPKRNNIIDQLDKVIGMVPEDGLFLFAFSGHGTEAEQKGYLLPQDAISADRNVRVLERTAIPVEDVREEIRIKGVRQVIVLLDSCRNDPRKDRGGGDNLMAEPLAAGFDFDRRNTGIQGFVTFYATRSGMRAYEDPERRQGYFSQAFIEGLSGGAKRSNGEVTLAGLIEYIEKQVPIYVRRSQERSARQEPRTVVEGYRAADLVLSVTTPVVAPVPTPTLDPEEEAWKVVSPSKNPEVVREFLHLYPKGRYAGAAQLKLKELETTTPLASEIQNPGQNPGIAVTPTAFMKGTVVNGKLIRTQRECEVYTEDLGNGVKL